MEHTDRSGRQQPVSSGVKRDARAAELPDEDEQDGKFQQVAGLTTDENTERVVEEIVKAIVARRKSSTRWKHSKSSMCAKICQEM